MPRITKTVKPAGGGDYTTGQDAINDAATLSGPENPWTIEFYDGDPGPLLVDIPSHNAQSLDEGLWLIAADGQSPHIHVSTGRGLVIVDTPYTLARGFKITADAEAAEAIQVSCSSFGSPGVSGVIVEQCRVEIDTDVDAGIAIQITGNVGEGIVIRRNVVLVSSAGESGGAAHGITATATTFTAGATAEIAIDRNTVYSAAAVSGSSGIKLSRDVAFGSANADLTATVRGNAVMGFDTDFAKSESGNGALITTASHNATGDATNDDFGSGNNIIVADPLSCFTDPGNGDLTLLDDDDNPLVDAGVAIPGIDEDFAGVSIPQGSAPDIGAYELEQEAASGGGASGNTFGLGIGIGM